MKTKRRTKNKRRLTLAQQVARLKAANDRTETRMKANPPLSDREWLAKTWGDAFKTKGRHA